MSDRILTPKEIEQATGYKRPSAQARELQRQKVRFRHDRDGRPLPQRMHTKGHGYYYVAGNKWTRLGKDYAEALHRWAELEGGTVEEVLRAYSLFTTERDRARIREARRKWREKNPELHKRRVRESSRKAWRRKNGVPDPTRPEPPACECCGKEKGSRALCVDHCHETGAFRGWLCVSCNTSIGGLGDDVQGLERALAYLKRAGS